MKISHMRNKLKITQEDLAQKLNADRSTVAKWETGQALPRVDKLHPLSEILGCTIDELME